MGFAATGVAICSAMVAAAIVHHLFSGIQTPATADTALVVLAVVAALVIAWVVYLVSTTRTLMTSIQRELELAPTAAPESDADTRRVLSFSIVAKRNSLPHPPPYSGAGMCTCPGTPSASARPGIFRRTAWLTPAPGSGATAMTNAILSGRVKYLTIGGTVAGVTYSQKHQAVMLYDLSSFKAPDSCTAVKPLPAIPGTHISDSAWHTLVGAINHPGTPLHVIAF